MNKKFDYIILPPDSFHKNFFDLQSKSIINFQLIIKEILKINENKKENILVKYRTKRQRENFPCKLKFEIGYKGLINFSHKKTTVEIKIEALSIDVLDGLLSEMKTLINKEVENGKLTFNDGDSIKWNTTRKDVEF